ncbi:gypsy type transposase [Tanacetum coccineum]|uniref:Gypsy type transposase n=1 Tax=Tanacetum coccineum TaxID=301880 RepID=A0ABQ5GUF2_9ASTR
MNGIINTEEDATFFRERGIVVNQLKSDQEVANLWNGMSKSVKLTKVPKMDKVIEDVNKRFAQTWRVKMANFMKTYLRAVNVTRLRFRDGSASSVTICFSVTFPCTWPFRINLSQLSVIAQPKFLTSRSYVVFIALNQRDVVCYTKPLDSLKHWNDYFFWVDSFACPASFPWHTGKNVSRDPFPKSTEFNADDYAVLVAHPAPFRKFPEPFLCLVGMSRYYTLDEDTYPRFLHDDGEGGCLSLYIVCPVVFYLAFDCLFVYAEMDLSAFIHVVDPTKVKVVEREHVEGERKLLESTIGRMVLLLSVAPARFESKLEVSVDKLFDEGGSADQRDSAAGSGHDAKIELVAVAEDVVVITAERPRRQRKKRPAVTDASGSSHPPKKLSGDHGISSRAATGSKSPSVLKELLASNILNVEVGVEAVATLPLITSSISATLEREGGDTDSVTGTNLRTIGLSERFVISSDSSHRSSTNAAEAEVDSFIRSVGPPPVMTEVVITTSVASAPSIPVPKTGTKVISLVHAFMFHDSDSTGTVRPDVAGPSHILGKEISMGSREVNSETLHEDFVPQWNVSNDTLLDDHDVSRELIDPLAPPVLFAQIREMDYHHLFMEFNVGTARQACLNAEVRMRTEYCLSETKRLESESETAEAARLHIQVSAVEAAERVTKLQYSVSAKDLELKEFNITVSSLKSQNDGLVDQVHALETTCSGLRDQVSGYERLKELIEEFQDAQMNIVNDKVAKLDADLLEMDLHLEKKFYPHLLTTILSRRWLLTHGLKLVVIKCLNSSEYLTALGSAISRAIENGMQSGLLAVIDHEKAGCKCGGYYESASPEVPLDDAPGMSELQPDIEQLTLPIHHSEDQVVLGETSLSFALIEPLSAENLMGASRTSGSMPAVVATTTALSTTFASTSSIPPISIDKYEVVNADGQEDAQGNVQGSVASFPTVEFEKEELDTTLEHDPRS